MDVHGGADCFSVLYSVGAMAENIRICSQVSRAAKGSDDPFILRSSSSYLVWWHIMCMTLESLFFKDADISDAAHQSRFQSWCAVNCSLHIEAQTARCRPSFARYLKDVKISCLQTQEILSAMKLDSGTRNPTFMHCPLICSE